MSTQERRARVSAARFERLYAASSDPWGYLNSDYEREKYAQTLAALHPERLSRVLEVGCSIGVFTELLAPRCDELVAIDFAERALAIAAERLADFANVELLHASFPEQIPPGRWDTIVCSEILYYLDEAVLRDAIGWLSQQLEAGASVLAVSWRGAGSEEPMRGDEAHELLAQELVPWHTVDGRRPGYRFDRFDGDGR
jgi:cyclopropane fatty-acyl-phospholipid synthase-like methyltransferase